MKNRGDPPFKMKIDKRGSESWKKLISLQLACDSTILKSKACFRRRNFHVPNLMQMSSNKDFRSLTLGSAHEKFGV